MCSPAADRKLQFEALQFLKRHALFLELRDPCCSPVFGLVALIVLIERAPQELSSLIALRLAVRIAARVDIADHLGSSRRECRVQLLNAIAEVVAVGPRVTAAEDGNGLAAEVDVLDLVDEVVPPC